jgi:transcriptional regulator of aromatic amino acid metabolism
VVTATNKDLRRGIQEGSFRLDLYYRLNVIRLTIPPLRDRPEDILPLANHFLGVFNQRFGRQVREISPHAAEALLGTRLAGQRSRTPQQYRALGGARRRARDSGGVAGSWLRHAGPNFRGK